MDQNELDYIKIAYPPLDDLSFKIIVPRCPLVISQGLGNAWATGRYSDPRGVMELDINENKNVAQIAADGPFAYRVPDKLLPNLRLSFGRLHPFSLYIKAGDISNHLDLGGIPLSAVEIQYGSGSQLINFSYPNPVEMQHLRIQADGGWVQIKNIDYANATDIHLKGPSTSYHLSLNALLKKDITLYTGMSISKVEITLPTDTAVKVKSSVQPGSSIKDDFSRVDKEYCNTAAREEKSPCLCIHHVGPGPLKLSYF